MHACQAFPVRRNVTWVELFLSFGQALLVHRRSSKGRVVGCKGTALSSQQYLHFKRAWGQHHVAWELSYLHHQLHLYQPSSHGACGLARRCLKCAINIFPVQMCLHYGAGIYLLTCSSPGSSLVTSVLYSGLSVASQTVFRDGCTWYEMFRSLKSSLPAHCMVSSVFLTVWTALCLIPNSLLSPERFIA